MKDDASGDDIITLRVRIQPRSSQEGFDIMADGHVRVRVNAPPVDNAANKRLIALLASAFRVATSRVELVRGAKHRDKYLRIHGARRTPPWLCASAHDSRAGR